jgi:hypothetical protein
VKITRLASFGEMSITSSDPSESFERGVSEIDTDHGHQIFVIIGGEAAVGAERTPVEKLDAIEVAPGEALELRAATSPTRYWKIEFDK